MPTHDAVLENAPVEHPAHPGAVASGWEVAQVATGWTSARPMMALDDKFNETLYLALAASQELVSGPIFVD